MSALPFILGAIFGGTVLALIQHAGDRRQRIYRDMRGQIKRLKHDAAINANNATRNLELALDWRVKALNNQYANETLARIHADPICRHECEVRLGDSIWDSLVTDEFMREAA